MLCRVRVVTYSLRENLLLEKLESSNAHKRVFNYSNFSASRKPLLRVFEYTLSVRSKSKSEFALPTDVKCVLKSYQFTIRWLLLLLLLFNGITSWRLINYTARCMSEKIIIILITHYKIKNILTCHYIVN